MVLVCVVYRFIVVLCYSYARLLVIGPLGLGYRYKVLGYHIIMVWSERRAYEKPRPKTAGAERRTKAPPGPRFFGSGFRSKFF